MKIVMKFEKETKNTLRFQEDCGPLDTPKLGVLYVPKETLKEIGYTVGAEIVVELVVLQ